MPSWPTMAKNSPRKPAIQPFSESPEVVSWPEMSTPNSASQKNS